MKNATVCVIENPLGQVLLLQRVLEPHGMCLPGGKVDENESIIDACCREAWEETRIMIAKDGLDYLGQVGSVLNDDYTVHVYYYKLDAASENFSPTRVILAPREHIGFAWTTLPESSFQLAGNTGQMIQLWRSRAKTHRPRP